MRDSVEKPMLLAPAGSANALRAAVFNGADAVYLGLNKFNARLKAENFSLVRRRGLRDRQHFAEKGRA